MIRLDLIKEGLSQVKGKTGNEAIDRAKGKYEKPKTFRGILKMLHYRYG